MRIAQVAPLWEQVPPPAYGGIELVVSLLTEELVRRGHDITLFASGDSITHSKLESVHPKALRLDTSVHEYSIYDMLNMNRVYERADEFDIIHSHVGCVSMPYSTLVKTPTIHTLHGVFTADNEKMFSHVRNQPFISISNSQRETRLGLNYVATIYNGIDPTTYKFHLQPDHPPYLAFLGRMSPEKGAHLAVEIAKQSGWHLKMAGKVDEIDLEYFEREIKPHIDGFQIEFLGEANHEQKSILMGGAVATLFPITWQEPFGLVMIESMVTGTPVIAIALGSVPEIIADGLTGILCQNVAECVAAIAKVALLDRRACREHILLNFTAKHMADGYEAVYQKILAEKYSRNGHVKTLAVR
ncbi:glycosyltransferase family 4 protein [Pseudanabaena sp. UWO310]|uniref:glycosyltransferase family 4 protein n=1 Tax=Pseudanabaena sp. UWO310 TaxID=2480795 RepID=UPI00115BAD05|nr:glycosyltransferase family 4 protein [Pseudanabaena sp. UWO310]TYQ26266.1 glycosyltransferase family 4 protein [Pseudanabaena sp. UWO310]